MDSGSDSDAPEELTAAEGVKQNEDIKKVTRENSIRVAKEGKERRRKWSERKTAAAKPPESGKKVTVDVEETEEESYVLPGMLTKDILDKLAECEKLTFASDSEEEIVERKVSARKKKQKTAGRGKVLRTKKMPPGLFEQGSMEFLRRRKMQVPRSSNVLRNADQALRLLSSKLGL